MYLPPQGKTPGSTAASPDKGSDCRSDVGAGNDGTPPQVEPKHVIPAIPPPTAAAGTTPPHLDPKKLAAARAMVAKCKAYGGTPTALAPWKKTKVTCNDVLRHNVTPQWVLHTPSSTGST